MAANGGKVKVLFLCTGNACRSQMAEGWARYLKGNEVEAYSAGMRAIGVNEWAIKVMEEAGVDISMHTSKNVEDLDGIDFDYVVTLCDNAAESCPVFGGQAKMIHKPFEDPYYASGSQEQIMEVFRKVRDKIKAFVETIPGSF